VQQQEIESNAGEGELMKRIISFFLPKETVFFELFEKEAQNCLEGAEALKDFLEVYGKLSQEQRKKKLAEVKAFETKGDDITREIIDHLHTTFITPIDHEDIHELAVRLDDSVDLVDILAKKIIYYKLKKIPEPLKKQMCISCEQLAEVKKEIKKLREGKTITEEHKKIYALETLADTIHSMAMEELFDNHPDPLEVIKLKDLYETAEHLTDKAQHISIILDGIVIRNA
jgi:uncharacterized protein Yka (UPF0111/DUF47 family)